MLTSSPDLVKNIKGTFIFQITKDGAVAGTYNIVETCALLVQVELSVFYSDITISNLNSIQE